MITSTVLSSCSSSTTTNTTTSLEDNGIDSTTKQREQEQQQEHQQQDSSSSTIKKVDPKSTLQQLLHNTTVSDILLLNNNTNTKWVLVENGSFGGVFDWVPYNLRNGDWKAICIVYLFIVQYLTILSGVYLYSTNTFNFNYYNYYVHSEELYDQYPKLYSTKWYIALVSLVWMIYIIYLIIFESPAGIGAWVTYTCQSWTLLTFRHLLCLLLPIYKPAYYIAELLRFPTAISPTITFVVWNFFIFPYVYFVAMQTDEQRSNLWKFCTSFRMLNIHFFNIVLCTANIDWYSPHRQLYWTIDFYPAVLSVVVYMSFYLLLLDRIGIHIYPIFSPRSYVAVGSWTFSILVYPTGFLFWRWLLVSSK